MQAIVTKYHGPTDYRGSRVTAKCEAARITIGWDDALNTEQNHRAAAVALIRKLGWNADCYKAWYQGGLPDGTGDVFVCAADYAKVEV